MASRILYVRGVPDALFREAKALAARRGTTLTAVVIEALEQVVHGDGSREGPGATELAADMEWFERNRARLVKSYPDEHVAIVGRRVVDHDREFGELARRVFDRLGARPVLMPRCSPVERRIRLPSPRVVRR